MPPLRHARIAGPLNDYWVAADQESFVSTFQALGRVHNLRNPDEPIRAIEIWKLVIRHGDFPERPRQRIGTIPISIPDEGDL